MSADRNHCTPRQVYLRNRPGVSVCIDLDCDLSGGYAHVGPCEPCGCGQRHAIEECVTAQPSPYSDMKAQKGGER